MTNREKCLDELLAARVSCMTIAMKRGAKNCAEGCATCEAKNLEWLKDEYKEPEQHTHNECKYANKIENVKHTRYCVKRCHTVNGEETINGCKDFENV